ncbi:unnamed protein product [Sphagnum jensenii]
MPGTACDTRQTLVTTYLTIEIVQIVCESDVSVGSSLVDTLARRYWVKMLALFSRMLDITSLKKQQELEPFLGHSRT